MMNEETFQLELPSGFEVLREEGRLQCVSREPAGVLLLTPERVENREELPNLSRMLAGFLTRTGHPVATDELLRVTSVPGAHGFSWQYTEGGNYHRLWLFGNELSWLLVTFLCPQENQVAFQDILRGLISSVRLRDDVPSP